MSEQPKEMWTTPAIVKAQADKYGSRTFCTFYDGASLSFEDLDTQSSRLASALADLGVGAGDRVMGMIHNGAEFLLTMIATHKRQAIFVPVNIELRGAFLEHQVRTISPKVLFLNDEFIPVFEAIACDDVGIESTVVIGDDVAVMPGTNAHGFEALRNTEARPGDNLPVSQHDICMIMFTSGTTGPSKGVTMPQALCYIYALGAMRATNLTDSDAMYIAMPLFHGTALLLQFYSALLSGSSVHIVKRFSASTWLSDVKREQSTVTYAVGVMPEFIVQQPARDDDKDNSLRLVWAVPVAERWGEEFERRFDLRILQGYGMTEFGICVWGDLRDPVLPGCAGHVFDDFYQVRIVDPETDEPLGANAVGEVVVRAKEPSGITAGYFRMPEETVKATRNLWFHSGDAGYLDDDGRLYFVDRIKDRIRRRGENISAYEVEQVLNGHDDVLDSAVVAVKPDGAGGEDEVMAYVVPRSQNVDPVALLDWCVADMPRYAVPRYFEFVSDIERTPSGKIRKQALRDAGIKPTAWDRESVGYVVPRAVKPARP